MRIRVADPGTVDARRVESLLEATKPTHVAHNFVVTDPRGRRPGSEKSS